MRCWLPHVITVIALAGCGGHGSGGGAVGLDQLGAQTAAAVCTKWAACCNAQELMDKAFGATSEADCETKFAALIDGLLVPVLQDSVANGRMVYHGDLMGDCLASYSDLTCVEFELAQDVSSGGGPCDDPFEGRVADGAACASDGDCISNYCSGDSIGTNNMINFGVCKVAPTAGTACDDFNCAGGAFCDNAGTCQTLHADGDACTGDDECLHGRCDPATNLCGVTTTCDGM